MLSIGTNLWPLARPPNPYLHKNRALESRAHVASLDILQQNMLTKNPQPFLPPDLVLYVIDFIPPTSDTAKIAYEPSHILTRTLLALTLTSRIIYPTARRLLYTHCLYVDSPRRLRCLLSSLSAYTADLAAPQSLPPIESKPSTIQHETSLYLAPFLNDTINDLPTAQAVHHLLSLLAPTLRRLVIDIPVRSLDPEGDTLGIRRVLKKAFTRLTSLELFCSVRYQMFLDYLEDNIGSFKGFEKANVWPLWPQLRTLALYNCDLSSERLWLGLSMAERLETLVLTRADGVREVDFRSEWIARVNGDRGLTVWFVDVDGGRGIPETIEEPDEGDKIKIMVGRVPTSYYGDEDVIELCQNWIKRLALKGEAAFQEELRKLSM